MSKKSLLNLIVVLTGLNSCSCISTAAARPEVGPNESSAIGITVVDIRSKKVLYEKNSDRPYTPASVQKIITALAALHYFGPSYQFSTELRADHVDLKNHSAGNLYLVGSGDPSLTDQGLNKLAQSLKQQGITKITGEINIDNSAFNDDPWGPGWQTPDLHKGFASRISALSVNANKITIELFPGKTVGSPPAAVMHPLTDYITLGNHAVTNKAPSVVLANSKINISAPGLSLGDKIHVSGHINLHATPDYTSFPVKSPGHFSAYILNEKLKMHGIQTTGRFGEKPSPSDATVLAIDYSGLLSVLITDILKHSQNHGAEMLFKGIGRKVSGKPGSFENGADAIYRFLEKEIDIKRADLVVADGSGLSLMNQISPSQLVRIIMYGVKNTSIAPEFLSALAISGTDGTLKNYFPKGQLTGQIRAKTGTMHGLQQIAGYACSADGEEFAFAILGEEHAAKPSAMKALHKVELGKLVGN